MCLGVLSRSNAYPRFAGSTQLEDQSMSAVYCEIKYSMRCTQWQSVDRFQLAADLLAVGLNTCSLCGFQEPVVWLSAE